MHRSPIVAMHERRERPREDSRRTRAAREPVEMPVLTKGDVMRLDNVAKPAGERDD
jgi:hypothetical protein